MAASINQLGYKKLSQIIFEWQAADRASLLALFIVMEVSLHWVWCLFVWLFYDSLDTYVDMELLYPIWIGLTVVGLFFWWMVSHLSRIKNHDRRLLQWQIVLIVVYSLYIGAVILFMGHSSLVSGVSLVGGAMLAMMLAKRSYIWRAFLAQVALILLVTTVPYLGVNLPNLRQLPLSSVITDGYSYVTYSEMTSIENAIATSIFKDGILSWDSIDELRRSSAFFWRSTHLYLALPKAIFIVYVFRTLLLILDDSKDEIIRHANQDQLTTLNNRRYGLTQMQQTLMATTAAQDYSIVLLDLDLFKNINDNHGHDVGDQVLREVGQVLSAALPDKAIISRYGGEEFLMLLPNTIHDEALAIAEQLRNDIAQHMILVDESLSFQVTASLGLYTLTHAQLKSIIKEHTPDKKQIVAPKRSKLLCIQSRRNRQQAAQIKAAVNAQLSLDICKRLISTADKALYKAKDHGRNKVVSANHLLADGVIAEQRYGT